ncbi:MAG: hypothetical protein AMJ67_12975, partial [Betaproteobacteria bacterium SG8_41]
AAVDEAGAREVFPHGDLFIDGCGAYRRIVRDLTVVVAVLAARAARDGRDGLAVVARVGAIAVEEPEEGALVISSCPFSTPPSRRPMITSTMAISIRVKPCCFFMAAFLKRL